MKPSFHWLWFCGICYAIGMDAVWASTPGIGSGIGVAGCKCTSTTYTLLSDNLTYRVRKPDVDVAAKCSDCTYTTTYACAAGYYLTSGGKSCGRCPNNQQSADKNSGGITDCYAPANTTFAKSGNKFKYIENCYYNQSATGNDWDSETTTTS